MADSAGGTWSAGRGRGPVCGAGGARVLRALIADGGGTSAATRQIKVGATDPLDAIEQELTSPPDHAGIVICHAARRTLPLAPARPAQQVQIRNHPPSTVS
jgi:hypothetical protein